MIRVPYGALEGRIERTLAPFGFEQSRAWLCARLFAETTRDGVYTHGLNRLPRFLGMLRSGDVVPEAPLEQAGGFGAMERWNGNRGPGNLNAHACMNRAIELARQYGLGCVALAQTNHWMRGGTYGWQAADAGMMALCFTNTLPNLPAWGTAKPVLGNNPLVLAVPRPGGVHVVLDMAMSQYSYGTLAAYRSRNGELPYPGGYDADGNLTTDPAAIEQTGRALPVGLWKGSGLALTLDLIAAMLSGGLATHHIDHSPEHETGLSQVFLAIDPARAGDAKQLAAIAEGVLADLHSAPALETDRPPRYPGEETLRLRAENLRLGVPVDETIWDSLAE